MPPHVFGIAEQAYAKILDNGSNQSILVSGFSSSVDGAIIAYYIWSLIASLHIRLWTERVDSESNIADLPTRLSDAAEDELASLGFIRSAFDDEWSWELTTTLQDSKDES